MTEHELIRFSDEIRTEIADDHTRIVLDIVESNLEHWYGLYDRAARDELSAGTALAQGGGRNSVVVVLHNATLIGARIIGLTETLIELVNSQSVYAAAPVCRALWEQCCVPCYMAEEIGPRLRKHRANDVVRLLMRVGLGTNIDAGYGHIRPIKVKSLNAATQRWVTRHLAVDGQPEEEIQISRQGYGPLSDLTHPNWRALNPNPRQPGEPHVLRPTLDLEILSAIVGPCGVMLPASRMALSEVVLIAFDHAFEYSGEPVWHDGDLFPTED